MNRITLIVFCSALFFLVSFSGVVAYRIWQVEARPEASFSPKQLSNTLDPPSQALSGKVIEVSGAVTTIPRDAEEPVSLTPDVHIQQGESITTTKGTTVVQFAEAQISLRSDTSLSFGSTDPAHFLIGHERGGAIYTTDETVQKISIRSLDGLFTITQGTVDVLTDPDDQTLRLKVMSGSGEFGYINDENKTRVVQVKARQVLSFDNEKLSVVLQ
jgi:hypothetical protein